MNDMIGSLLSDPESMQQIKELADMLKTESEENGAAPGQTGSDGGGADFSALAGMLGSMMGSSQKSGESSGGGMDLEMIMQLMQIMTAAGNDDKDRNLLMALRPHLSADKQEKIDRAVKLLKIYAIITTLKNSGMLGRLDKLF